MTQHDRTSESISTPPSFSVSHLLGVALAATMVLAIGAYALRSGPGPRVVNDCEEQETPTGEPNPQEFRKWEKPLVALVLSGQMHGYVDPCGCSEPQNGGLIRRYNFIQSLLTGASTLEKARWDVVGLDLGELAQAQGIQLQNLLKFDLSVKSLARMNYRAFGIGRDETLLPLFDGMAQIWDKKNGHPRPLNTSMDGVGPGQQLHGLNVRPYEIIESSPRLGVINLMGPDLRKQLAGQVKFANNQEELAASLEAFAKADVEVGIILHHEYPDLDPIAFAKDTIQWHDQMAKVRKKQALECAEFCAEAREKNAKIPPILLMMTLTESSEAAFSLRMLAPKKLPTQLLEVGHKGKYVGLVGIYGKKGAYRLDYDQVLMGPEWKTKDEDLKNHPIVPLFQDYNDKLKRHDLLAKFPRTQHFNQLPAGNAKGLKATYVGSQACAECHDKNATDAFDVWKKTPHFKATVTLEELKFPSGRHYDPECMKCHTTGFKHPSGYNDLVVDPANWPAPPAQKPNDAALKAHNDDLRGVGCETCHGPGSEHVKRPKDMAIRDLMNPFRISAEERALVEAIEKNGKDAKSLAALRAIYNGDQKRAMTRSCMVCHDAENDVNFGNPGHELFDKWIGKKLYHHTAKKKNAGVVVPVQEGQEILQGPAPVIEVIEDKKK